MFIILLTVPPREKLRKKNVPVIQKLPKLPNCENNVENAFGKLKQILHNLKINFRVLNKQVNLIALDIAAKSNTWSNQRRKKRQLKRMEQTEVKKIKLGCVTDAVNKSNESISSEKDSPQKSTELVQTTELEEKQETIPGDPNGKHNSTREHYQSSEEIEPLVQAFLKIIKKDNIIHLETVFLSGIGGKESLHQIVQYIKNNWK